jgi:hypothetical protein
MPAPAGAPRRRARPGGGDVWEMLLDERHDPEPDHRKPVDHEHIAGACAGAVARFAGRKRFSGRHTTLHGSHERRIDRMFSDEPDLELILADDVTDEEIVGAVVAVLRREPRHCARFFEHDLVRMQQA